MDAPVEIITGFLVLIISLCKSKSIKSVEAVLKQLIFNFFKFYTFISYGVDIKFKLRFRAKLNNFKNALC